MWTGDDRYDSDEDGVNSDSQRRKRLTGERSVFDRFIGESCLYIPLVVHKTIPTLRWSYSQYEYENTSTSSVSGSTSASMVAWSQLTVVVVTLTYTDTTF